MLCTQQKTSTKCTIVRSLLLLHARHSPCEPLASSSSGAAGNLRVSSDYFLDAFFSLLASGVTQAHTVAAAASPELAGDFAAAAAAAAAAIQELLALQGALVAQNPAVAEAAEAAEAAAGACFYQSPLEMVTQCHRCIGTSGFERPVATNSVRDNVEIPQCDYYEPPCRWRWGRWKQEAGRRPERRRRPQRGVVAAPIPFTCVQAVSGIRMYCLSLPYSTATLQDPMMMPNDDAVLRRHILTSGLTRRLPLGKQ